MSSRVIVNNTAPVTQTVAAVVELLRYLGRPYQPLPETVQLAEMLLVLSNKKDVFYAATAHSCSCPSAVYRPGQTCKHQRKYFPADPESIRPTGRWPGGWNGPVEVD
jgi:hypothetical protein